MSSTLKEKVKVYLALRSGGVCAYPECRVRLTQGPSGSDEGVVIGEAAHIFGERAGSARFDVSKSIEFLNSAENLIYLCPTHHTLVDKQRETYTTEELLSWKSNHERRMLETIPEQSIEVTLDELQIATESPSRKVLLEEVQHARHSEEYRVGTQDILEENQDSLTPILTGLSNVDRDVRRRVLGYSRWYDPAEKSLVLEILAMLGHEQGLVENNAQRLHEADLIQITENHYLPLNEEICQQAAESLMDEFLRELEE